MQIAVKSRHGWLTWEPPPYAAGGLAASAAYVGTWTPHQNLGTVFRDREVLNKVLGHLRGTKDPHTDSPLVVFEEDLSLFSANALVRDVLRLPIGAPVYFELDDGTMILITSSRSAFVSGSRETADYKDEDRCLVIK